MSAGAKLLPQTPMQVTIKNEYSPGFLSAISSEIIKDPLAVLMDKIIKPLETAPTTLKLNTLGGGNRADIDITLNIDEGDKKATSDMAFMTFMLSRYHKEYRKQGTASKFSVMVSGSAPLEFYCMKGYTYGGEEEYVTDNDMILASILGLNTVVRSLRENGLAGMHPLSRMAVTEEGIESLADFIIDNGELSSRFYVDPDNKSITPVKLFNTACARKSHQFYGSTKYYFPELAAAQLIMGVMSSKSQSPTLIDITNRNLQKIARAAGNLDRDLVVDLMEHCTPPGAAYNAQELYDKYKNKSKVREVPKVARKVATTTAFKKAQMQEEETLDRARKQTKGSASKKTRELSTGSSVDDVSIDDGEKSLQAQLDKLNSMAKNNKNRKSKSSKKAAPSNTGADEDDQFTEDK